MALQEDEGQEESYVRIKILGKGAFGEAVLYRKPDVRFTIILHILISFRFSYCLEQLACSMERNRSQSCFIEKLCRSSKRN